MLQMQWDAALIRGWQEDRLVRGLCATFMTQHKLNLEQFQAQLKRVPRQPGQFARPIRAFVAHALPWLSERLWNGVAAADLVLKLDGTTLDTGCAPPGLRRNGELAMTYQDERRTRSIDVHKGHRRSDWHICKR